MAVERIKANDIPKDVHTWLQQAESRLNSFAINLGNQIATHGGLSIAQIEAVKRAIHQDRQYELNVKTAQGVPVTGVAPIVECLQKAIDNGLKAPKIRLGKFAFNLAKPTGANPGAIYIKESGEYLGKIMQGQLRLLRQYQDRTDEILDVAKDPLNAAIAYGKEFGLCAMCGRDLSDPVSVERGIGPICADRFGF
jgi:hypothetical protein